MIVAPLERGNIDPLRALLATMNSGPGAADPANPLVPFAQFENLHFARFVVLDDPTTGDLEKLYGTVRPEPPVYLAFLGDFDGDYDAFIDLLVARAGTGLRRIFTLCGLSPGSDLRAWMVAHEQPPVAFYTNWVGRTVQQARQEERLRQAIADSLARFPNLTNQAPRVIHERLRQVLSREIAALTRPAATPIGWLVRHMFDWIVLAAVIVATPIVFLLGGFIPFALLAWKLRSLEKSEPEYAPRPDAAWQTKLWSIEDFGVTNQFTAIGSIKPGWFRAGLFRAAMWLINLAARTIYTKGRLARVYTIHCARWVYLDNRQRAMFASNYDGSLESYMDDFINKVGFGLNAAFCAGIGYPRTKWLVLEGAKNEELFKNYLRRHNLPTEVWYNAHAGLTAHDLQRNAQIRDGLEKSSLSETEAAEWVTLL